MTESQTILNHAENQLLNSFVNGLALLPERIVAHALTQEQDDTNDVHAVILNSHPKPTDRAQLFRSLQYRITVKRFESAIANLKMGEMISETVSEQGVVSLSPTATGLRVMGYTRGDS